MKTVASRAKKNVRWMVAELKGNLKQSPGYLVLRNTPIGNTASKIYKKAKKTLTSDPYKGPVHQ